VTQNAGAMGEKPGAENYYPGADCQAKQKEETFFNVKIHYLNIENL
jgi:hypothetical protein